MVRLSLRTFHNYLGCYRFHKCGCRKGCPNSVLEGGELGGVRVQGAQISLTQVGLLVERTADNSSWAGMS
jgi:hypothetical protein